MNKEEVNVGSLFSNGDELIYIVTWFVFTDLVQNKNGEQLPINEVHVDIYKENEIGDLNLIGAKNFLNIKYLKPLPIRENYLKHIGFTAQDFNGDSVLQKNNLYFKNSNTPKGVHFLQNLKNENLYPVSSMHEVQILLNRL